MRIALEARFPIPAELPEGVAGILVLGGTADPWLTQATGQPTLNGNVERLVVASDLAARYPAAKVVIAGGAGPQELREADVEGAILERLGVAARRIVHERSSQNSYENIAGAMRLVVPAAGEVWVLVTSAAHMPRAVGVARQQGWEMIPFPVDHSFRPGAAWRVGFNFNLGQNLIRLHGALHEWVGLISYRLLGRSDSWFPGPKT
jgi:uncharacterized SAM-binding protein YcdF (DUF218 family)